MSTTIDKRKRSQHQPTGSWIRRERRLAIYLRDRFTCLYCLRDLHGASPQDVTLDHVVCQSSDGHPDHSTANLVTACRACNCARQDKPLARFASPEARAHIRRNTSRKIMRYLKLAKSIIAGEVGFEEALERLP
jgi:5-methylcytosine-specific restriction endonuclease McrA